MKRSFTSSDPTFVPGQHQSGSSPRVGDATFGTPEAQLPAVSLSGEAAGIDEHVGNEVVQVKAREVMQPPVNGASKRCVPDASRDTADILPNVKTAGSPRLQAACQTRSQAAVPAALSETMMEENWISAAALTERREKMFSSVTFEPKASGMGGSVLKATRQLVKLSWECVTEPEWKQEQVDALSCAYGNFDRVVAAGWLVGDALGLPLLDRREAFALGGSVRYHAGKTDSKIDGIRAAARSRARKAAGGVQHTCEEEAALLCEEVQLKLPKLPEASVTPRTVAAGKRKREERSAVSLQDTSTGWRKRQEADEAAAKAAAVSKAAAELKCDAEFLALCEAWLHAEQAYFAACQARPFFNEWREAIFAAGDALEAAEAVWAAAREAKLAPLHAAIELAGERFDEAVDVASEFYSRARVGQLLAEHNGATLRWHGMSGATWDAAQEAMQVREQRLAWRSGRNIWAGFDEWQDAQRPPVPEEGVCPFGAECPYATGELGPANEESIREEARKEVHAELEQLRRQVANANIERDRAQRERDAALEERDEALHSAQEALRERDEARAENDHLWSQMESDGMCT